MNKTNQPVPKGKKITLMPIGLGLVAHDLICWICNKKSAVYDANPAWVFRPCWGCQKKINRTGRVLFIDKLPWIIQRLLGDNYYD